MVLSEVPANSTVVGFKARVVKRDGVRIDRLDHANLPDPVVDMFRMMQDQINELHEELKQEKERNGGNKQYDTKNI
ncbi:Serine acetyltransferase [compost metagenome]